MVARTEHAIVGEVYDQAARPGAASGRIACIAHHWNQRGDEVVDVVGICATTTSTSGPTRAGASPAGP